MLIVWGGTLQLTLTPQPVAEAEAPTLLYFSVTNDKIPASQVRKGDSCVTPTVSCWGGSLLPMQLGTVPRNHYSEIVVRYKGFVGKLEIAPLACIIAAYRNYHRAITRSTLAL
eukprot:311936-Rhodomonas_salina.4